MKHRNSLDRFSSHSNRSDMFAKRESIHHKSPTIRLQNLQRKLTRVQKVGSSDSSSFRIMPKRNSKNRFKKTHPKRKSPTVEQLSKLINVHPRVDDIKKKKEKDHDNINEFSADMTPLQLI